MISILALCLLTCASAQAKVNKNNSIFGQWLSIDHRDNKQYRSILVDQHNNIRVLECKRSQTPDGVELSAVVCNVNNRENKFLKYNANATKFWFSQSSLTELEVDPSGDVMYESTGVGFLKSTTEWYRVYDPMVEFVYVK